MSGTTPRKRPIDLLCAVCDNSAGTLVLQAPDRFHGRATSYQLARCEMCQLVQLLNPPSLEDMPFHYGYEYHKAIDAAGDAHTRGRWDRQRHTLHNFKKGGSILDIGCSTGAFLQTLMDSRWRLHGIEISANEAATAAALTGADIFVGDPLDAPYKPATFDAVTCFHLLEHVHRPLELVRRIRTWLKPQGVLYVIVPNIASYEARIFRSYWYGLELPRHLFHFSPQSLERIAHDSHMRTVSLCTYDSFSEHSLHYVFEHLSARCGVAMAPLARRAPAPFSVKVIRKLFRGSLEFLFRNLADSAGSGAAIEAVFVND